MDCQALLLHQVHAAKLATDISAGIVSGWLMWQRCAPAALLAGFLPAVIASALVTRRDLSALADTRRGRYVLVHMPPAAQALRLAGQVVVWRAEYEHSLAGITAGHALVAVGWSHGMLASARRMLTLQTDGATVLQTAMAHVGLWAATCCDACGLDRRLRCIPRMSRAARIGLRRWRPDGPRCHQIVARPCEAEAEGGVGQLDTPPLERRDGVLGDLPLDGPALCSPHERVGRWAHCRAAARDRWIRGRARST